MHLALVTGLGRIKVRRKGVCGSLTLNPSPRGEGLAENPFYYVNPIFQRFFFCICCPEILGFGH